MVLSITMSLYEVPVLSCWLTVQGLEGQLLLLRLACSANSHTRHVTLHRQHGSNIWPPFDVTFTGHDRCGVGGVFVTRVDAAARQSGLCTGDQVCWWLNQSVSTCICRVQNKQSKMSSNALWVSTLEQLIICTKISFANFRHLQQTGNSSCVQILFIYYIYRMSHIKCRITMKIALFSDWCVCGCWHCGVVVIAVFHISFA